MPAINKKGVNSMRFNLIVKTAVLAVVVFVLSFSQVAFTQENAGDKKAALDAEVVATVNDVKITAQELEQKLGLIKARYASMGMPIEGEQLNQLRESILDNLIEKQLLYQESKASGIEVDNEKIENEINKLKAQFESQEDFRKKIASSDYTEDSLRQEMVENMAIRQLIEEKIESKISVSDKELENYFKENQAEFEVPEQVHARHILIKTGPEASDEQKNEARKKIDEIQKKLDDGGDFAELAKEHSACQSGKQGGDLGYFGHGQMVESFDKAAFALEPGEISDVVESRFGYHLIKVEDKKPAGKKEYEDVKESIRQKLRQEKIMQDLEPYIESLKRKYPVEKNLPQSSEG
jgi:peptidyl-prolyl cis-trans isomerase C